jgi:uncharacterized protein (DUF4415 family)
MANKRNKQPQPDDDIPEMTSADFKRAKRMRDVMPEIVKALKRGRPKAENPKERVSLRIAPDILAAYRSTGPGWQSRIERTLKTGAFHLKREEAQHRSTARRASKR